METIKTNDPGFTKKDADTLSALMDEFLNERGETNSPEGKKLCQVLRSNIAAAFGEAD